MFCVNKYRSLRPRSACDDNHLRLQIPRMFPVTSTISFLTETLILISGTSLRHMLEAGAWPCAGVDGGQHVELGPQPEAPWGGVAPTRPRAGGPRAAVRRPAALLLSGRGTSVTDLIRLLSYFLTSRNQCIGSVVFKCVGYTFYTYNICNDLH